MQSALQASHEKHAIIGKGVCHERMQEIHCTWELGVRSPLQAIKDLIVSVHRFLAQLPPLWEEPTPLNGQPEGVASCRARRLSTMS